MYRRLLRPHRKYSSLGFLYISLISQWLTVSIVVQIYEFDGETRFVVRFEDGSESVFFAFELVAADKAAGQAG